MKLLSTEFTWRPMGKPMRRYLPLSSLVECKTSVGVGLRTRHTLIAELGGKWEYQPEWEFFLEPVELRAYFHTYTPLDTWKLESLTRRSEYPEQALSQIFQYLPQAMAVDVFTLQLFEQELAVRAQAVHSVVSSSYREAETRDNAFQGFFGRRRLDAEFRRACEEHSREL